MSAQNIPNTKPLPNRPDRDYVRYIPLGGLDEVGMNCSLIECNGSILMVDCGLTFPETNNFGVDIIVPDWTYLMENLDYLDGIILTHGHEDHIGALPFFLQEVDVPVFGSPLTLAMLKRKLDSHNLGDDVDLFPISPGKPFDIGPFEIEGIHVNHSVPQALSIALNTPLGAIIFTGDWKLDQTPVYEPVADLIKFADYGRQGTLALMADSTNAEVPGFSVSEAVVKKGIDDAVEQAPGRVIVAQFSSNLYRVASIIDIAKKHGRKVALLGHSLTKNFGLARETGCVPIPSDDLIIDAADIQFYPDDELIIISTGSQAEPRSSLARMSYGAHQHIDIRDSDTIILSARQIPGNEYSINFMINNLIKRGATIITTAEGDIHGSGHGHQEEIKLMLNLTRPTYLVPVHGEYRMRKHHAALGAAVGIPNNLLIENGDALEFTAKGAEVIGRVHTGRLLVDGKNVGDVEDIQLRDRRKLASAGLIVAFAVIDRETGALVSTPELLQRGVVGESESQEMLEEAAEAARLEVEQLGLEASKDISEVQEAIRVTIRRYFRKQLDRKPVVIPIVHEL